MNDRAMYRQVWILATAQALFQTASVLVMTIGGLAGQQISGRPEWATAPIAAMFLGTAVAMFPASGLMAALGRRAGFVTGTLLGIAGGLVSALGVYLGSLWLVVLGMFFFGMYAAFAQFYRFAAGEVASDAFRSRSIALVLAGGVVAALLGPALARLEGSMPVPLYAGSFLILAGLSALASVVLFWLRVPQPDAGASGFGQRRPWRVVVIQPAYLGALFGAATGFGVMILAMTATPIAMGHHHHEFSAAATVIQLHVLGMFLPSFFTGALIGRFGVLPIMLTGVMLLSGHVLMTATGTGFGSFASALILLGVGWNFLYIGGTELLTSTYSPAEKSSAQATNDMTIFVVGLACSFGAAPMLHAFGWQTLNLLLLPWLALAALTLVVLKSVSRVRAVAA
ncbi:MAG: MFS transporter [Panacagrimonas sp.]